jgi:hypothetical protein
MHLSSGWLLLLGIPLLQASENDGVKMTVEFGSQGRSSSRVTYLQSDRKRMEFGNYTGDKVGPRLVAIVRCDLGQMFELNLDTREYTSAPYPPKPLNKEEMARRGMANPIAYVSDKPTLRIEVTTTDTGERKEMFGHTARRVLTTRKETPLEGSQSRPQESETDGWYIDSNLGDGGIDLHQRLSCDRRFSEGKQGHSFSWLRATGGNQPIDRPEFVSIGTPETGFALQLVTTTKGAYPLPGGTMKQSDFKNEVRVTQLEEGPLDRSLFEIPPGFKHVDRIERNPALATSNNSLDVFWQRLKAGVANLFNR